MTSQIRGVPVDITSIFSLIDVVTVPAVVSADIFWFSYIFAAEYRVIKILNSTLSRLRLLSKHQGRFASNCDVRGDRTSMDSVCEQAPKTDMAPNERQPASTVAEWAAEFLVFLNENNYNRPNEPSHLQLHNLINLYELLFKHTQRPPQQVVFGPPPPAVEVVDYLITAGDLIANPDGTYSFP